MTFQERVWRAQRKMIPGTFGGRSRAATPQHLNPKRVEPTTEEPAIAEGTFGETDRTGGGDISGGTIDVTYGGSTTVTSYPGVGSFTPHVILFPAGFVILSDLTYEMTLSPTTTVAGGGYMRIEFIRIATNIQQAVGPDHFLSGTTPGSTVFTGSVVFGAYPFTVPVDCRLNIDVAGSGPKGVINTHWEVEVEP